MRLVFFVSGEGGKVERAGVGVEWRGERWFLGWLFVLCFYANLIGRFGLLFSLDITIRSRPMGLVLRNMRPTWREWLLS